MFIGTPGEQKLLIKQSRKINLSSCQVCISIIHMHFVNSMLTPND